MTEVTQILSQIERGDPAAARQLLPLVYEELRRLAAARLAQEKPGQTLQATALVHDVYIRLVDVEKAQHWNSRGHFFGAAAEAMRRILVENARHKKRRKHGAGVHHCEIQIAQPAVDGPGTDVLAIDEALNRFAESHPEKAELVKLRFFAGLTLAEAAFALGISSSSADRYWKYARAWLARELGKGDHDKGE